MAFSSPEAIRFSRKHSRFLGLMKIPGHGRAVGISMARYCAGRKGVGKRGKTGSLLASTGLRITYGGMASSDGGTWPEKCATIDS